MGKRKNEKIIYAISRKYADDPTNLVERSQADHKTNVRFTINQLLYDFGATQYDVSRNEALAKALSLLEC